MSFVFVSHTGYFLGCPDCRCDRSSKGNDICSPVLRGSCLMSGLGLLLFPMFWDVTFYWERLSTLAQPPAWRTRSPHLWPPEKGWPSYAS